MPARRLREARAAAARTGGARGAAAWCVCSAVRPDSARLGTARHGSAQSDPTRHDSAEAIRNSKASVPGEIGDSEIGDPH